MGAGLRCESIERSRSVRSGAATTCSASPGLDRDAPSGVGARPAQAASTVRPNAGRRRDRIASSVVASQRTCPLRIPGAVRRRSVTRRIPLYGFRESAYLLLPSKCCTLSVVASTSSRQRVLMATIGPPGPLPEKATPPSAPRKGLSGHLGGRREDR